MMIDQTLSKMLPNSRFPPSLLSSTKTFSGKRPSPKMMYIRWALSFFLITFISENNSILFLWSLLDSTKITKSFNSKSSMVTSSLLLTYSMLTLKAKTTKFSTVHLAVLEWSISDWDSSNNKLRSNATHLR